VPTFAGYPHWMRMPVLLVRHWPERNRTGSGNRVLGREILKRVNRGEPPQFARFEQTNRQRLNATSEGIDFSERLDRIGGVAEAAPLDANLKSRHGRPLTMRPSSSFI